MNKKITAKLLRTMCMVFTAGILFACSADKGTGTLKDSTDSQTLSTGAIEVEDDGEYGNVLIDLGADEFNKLGFNWGDSVDVSFSNGYELNDIPYYDGYYTASGEPLVVSFYDNILVVAINYGSMWEDASLSEGDTVTITLDEAGKYLDIQNAMDIDYSDNRDDYASDVVFANFRSVNTNGIKENTLYRSASPCDNSRNRASYTDELIKDAGVCYIVDLADSNEEIDGCMAGDDFDSPYFAALYEKGAVIPVNLKVDYTDESFKSSITEALRTMSQNDGPYLVHCLEGKDRTGFVCMLLESLTGAGYDELVEDYMTTYDNYYGINPKSDPDRYNVIRDNNFIPMLKYITGIDSDEDITTADFKAGATEYLKSGGMSEDEINALKDRL